MGRALWLSAVLFSLFAAAASPAAAGGDLRVGRYPANWRATHRAIYDLENLIAFLEADPQTDEGYKGPVITRARRQILRLRATLPPAHWRWREPCCYSRHPIYIR